MLPKLLAFLTLSAVPATAFAAAPSIEGLITMLVYLIVIGLIFWLVWWAINAIGIPEPFNKVIRVIVIVVAVLILLYFLLGLLPPLR